jgi:hypothetical protein
MDRATVWINRYVLWKENSCKRAFLRAFGSKCFIASCWPFHTENVPLLKSIEIDWTCVAHSRNSPQAWSQHAVTLSYRGNNAVNKKKYNNKIIKCKNEKDLLKWIYNGMQWCYNAHILSPAAFARIHWQTRQQEFGSPPTCTRSGCDFLCQTVISQTGLEKRFAVFPSPI